MGLEVAVWSGRTRARRCARLPLRLWASSASTASTHQDDDSEDEMVFGDDDFPCG